jgi:hypothetical protein
MNDVLADTHSLVWFLFDPGRLSPAADAMLSTAARSGTVYISSITLVATDSDHLVAITPKNSRTLPMRSLSGNPFRFTPLCKALDEIPMPSGGLSSSQKKPPEPASPTDPTTVRLTA